MVLKPANKTGPGQLTPEAKSLAKWHTAVKRHCTDWYLFIPKTRMAQGLQRPLPRSVVAKFEYMSSSASFIFVNFGTPQYYLALQN